MQTIKEYIRENYTKGSKIKLATDGNINNVYISDDKVFKVEKKSGMNSHKIGYINFLHSNGFPVPEILDRFQYNGNHVTVFEYIEKTDREMTCDDFSSLGNILSNMHLAGINFMSSNRLPAYEYSTDFREWQNLNLNKETEGMREICLSLREIAYDTYREPVNCVEYLEFKTAFLHRDIKFDNIILVEPLTPPCSTRFFLIDFDFAGLNFPAWEFIRLMNDIDREKGEEATISFVKAYGSNNMLRCTPWNALCMYLRYLIFNSFPFYIDKPVDDICEMAKQRNESLYYFTDRLNAYCNILEEYGGM